MAYYDEVQNSIEQLLQKKDVENVTSIVITNFIKIADSMERIANALSDIANAGITTHEG